MSTSVMIDRIPLMTQGNNLMKSEKFDEALKCYTKAIQLDGRNAVFYCNRYVLLDTLPFYDETQ